MDFKNLKNSYYIIRHGESYANVRKLIVSSPGNGIRGYGLTEEGKKQTEDSIKEYAGLDNIMIFSSDFMRTRETAEIIKVFFGIGENVRLTERLRERFFGDFEMKDNSNYELVWKNDADDPGHNINNVESVTSVLDRMLDQIREIESVYEGKNVMLVSHGDPLQILLTKFENLDPSRHRSVRHLNPAEIRALN